MAKKKIKVLFHGFGRIGNGYSSRAVDNLKLIFN